MPYKPDEREYRAMPMLTSSPQKRIDCENYIEGYATTFDDPYLLCSWDGVDYYEIIDRHALDNADISDVIMQYDHNGRVRARTSNNTLGLDIDDHGFFVYADLTRSGAAKELYEDVSAGLITKMSWAFTVAEDAYDKNTHTRTILKVKKVYDVSAVSMPANPSTDISARSYAEGRSEAEKREALERAEKQAAINIKRKKLILKLKLEEQHESEKA
ncbi:MAG TPA: HK97 family phage prohead protease [Candidatus Omnitrophota bacterium]|nr:HK97 family phage prohead protease [Candidatus Omnitrophota bacterium]